MPGLLLPHVSAFYTNDFFQRFLLSLIAMSKSDTIVAYGPDSNKLESTQSEDVSTQWF